MSTKDNKSAAPKVAKTDAEWKQELSPEAYRVARQHGTERAFTSPLNNEKRDGMFTCVCCGTPLFKSDDKFDSGTGWPSFTKPVDPKIVETETDRKFMMTRTEVHCARCDTHLGHLFPDGPRDKGGMRYCINSASLDFEESKEKKG